MNVTTAYVVDAYELADAVGCHWGEFEFAQMRESGSYIPFDVSDFAVESDDEMIRYYNQKAEEYATKDSLFADAKVMRRYAEMRKNDQKARAILRSMGYRDSVLVHLFW